MQIVINRVFSWRQWQLIANRYPLFSLRFVFYTFELLNSKFTTRILMLMFKTFQTVPPCATNASIMVITSDIWYKVAYVENFDTTMSNPIESYYSE